MRHDDLKEKHRTLRDNMPTHLNLRIHRSLSWLKRAELSEDTDGQFVFLWIAFNAAYAQEIQPEQRLSEQEAFRAFLQKLHQLDSHKQLHALVWQEFSGPIRLLLDNPYVFESFWEYHRGHLTEEQWMTRFSYGKRAASVLLSKGETAELLGLVLQRVYTLRNQIFHGGATYNSQVNRTQLQDCVRLMKRLVSVVLQVMLNSPQTLWGDACYPVIGD